VTRFCTPTSSLAARGDQAGIKLLLRWQPEK
jgi:hypothetical protein